MNFIVIEEGKLVQLFSDIAEIKKTMTATKEEEIVNKWLQSETARKMLGVCKKTWQEMRNKKMIPFSQFGRKVYVKRADLEEFMNKNYIKQ